MLFFYDLLFYAVMFSGFSPVNTCGFNSLTVNCYINTPQSLHSPVLDSCVFLVTCCYDAVVNTLVFFPCTCKSNRVWGTTDRGYKWLCKYMKSPHWLPHGWRQKVGDLIRRTNSGCPPWRGIQAFHSTSVYSHKRPSQATCPASPSKSVENLGMKPRSPVFLVSQSKSCGLEALASPGNLLKIQTLRLPDMLHRNLHFNKMPRWSVCTLKSAKYSKGCLQAWNSWITM